MFTHCFVSAGELWFRSLAAVPHSCRDELALGWKGIFPSAALQVPEGYEGRQSRGKHTALQSPWSQTGAPVPL